ncbi:uncharacterized protein LOC126475152 [Schistocerca serialis cubense]|uniref:uncharacterized protein LOC126475152 n=1 Tax=Schistocerca serialis cubense TaxID=2023355 RepID=UPI00214F2C70|nr:uncharacterized protein LOC126475152 [Schistocerca serialis cubense]XP_049958726.1 uncharacterized protein LOC126475152 [Schistocerca serialis cubense]
MAGDLSLPDSLEKLEIDIKRVTERNSLSTSNPFSQKTVITVDERALLKSLSLSGEKCVSTSCKCNTQKHKSHKNGKLEGNLRSSTFKRSIVRKSRLNFLTGSSVCKRRNRHNSILRDPILHLPSFSPLKPARFSVMEVRLRNVTQFRVTELIISPEVSGVVPFGNNVTPSDFKSLFLKCENSNEETKDYETVNFQNLQAGTSLLTITDDDDDESKSTKTAAKSSPNRGTQGQTCSQQALMSTPTNCDDVTIDELASYFDVFVHIPKKMSHMAEMMYI